MSYIYNPYELIGSPASTGAGCSWTIISQPAGATASEPVAWNAMLDLTDQPYGVYELEYKCVNYNCESAATLEITHNPCTACDLYNLSMVINTSPSFFNAEELISGSHDIYGYTIQWYINSVTPSNYLVTSGWGNGFNSVYMMEHFVGGETSDFPSIDGSLIPLLTYIDVTGDGVNDLPSTEDDCLTPATISNLDCADLPFSYEYSSKKDVQTYFSFNFDVDATNYILAKFTGYIPEDKITSIYNGTVYESAVIGTGNISSSDISTSPKIIKNIDATLVLYDPSEYIAGIPLNIIIEANQEALDTDWDVEIFCCPSIECGVIDTSTFSFTSATYDTNNCNCEIEYNLGATVTDCTPEYVNNVNTSLVISSCTNFTYNYLPISCENIDYNPSGSEITITESLGIVTMEFNNSDVYNIVKDYIQSIFTAPYCLDDFQKHSIFRIVLNSQECGGTEVTNYYFGFRPCIDDVTFNDVDNEIDIDYNSFSPALTTDCENCEKFKYNNEQSVNGYFTDVSVSPPDVMKKILSLSVSHPLSIENLNGIRHHTILHTTSECEDVSVIFGSKSCNEDCKCEYFYIYCVEDSTGYYDIDQIMYVSGTWFDGAGNPFVIGDIVTDHDNSYCTDSCP